MFNLSQTQILIPLISSIPHFVFIDGHHLLRIKIVPLTEFHSLLDDELESFNIMNNGKCKYYLYFTDEENVFSNYLRAYWNVL